MRTIGKRITTPLFALLMAAMLTFGTAAAFAETQNASCPIDRPTHQGVCTSELQCDQWCWADQQYDGACEQAPGGVKCCTCVG